jgi:hypothetical protein
MVGMLRLARLALCGLLVSVLSAEFAAATEYKTHDRVPVHVNTVGPFHNPAEVYPYYSLPYCAPKQRHGDDDNLGEVLAGDRRRSSLYEIRFNVDVQWAPLCHFQVTFRALHVLSFHFT